MHLQLGSSGTLIDGSPSWNKAAEDALALWNPFLNDVSFRVVRDSTAATGIGNGVNNVIWRGDVYGEPFGTDVAAVALYRYRISDNRFTEGDVIFNTAYGWNSYRGNQRAASGGGSLLDLRRFALHEFGHTLGLDHPDEHGQSVTAIMNSVLSNTDDLQSDDVNGARAIYGSTSTPPPTPPPPPSNRAPTVTASCNPCTVAAGQTTTLRATATDPDGDSLTYQWTAAQGAFSNATAANTAWTAPAQRGSVTATVTVQDGRGGRATATVTLQVPNRAPTVTVSCSPCTVEAGQTTNLRATATDPDGDSMTYQWTAPQGAFSSATAANTVWTAPLQPGSVTATVTVQDDRGGRSTGTVGLQVVFRDRLPSGARLLPGQSLSSTNGRYRLLYQTDGNLVLYDDVARTAPWTSSSAGTTAGQAIMQTDGNFVVYDAQGIGRWTTATAGNANAYLVVQSDGNIVVYRSNGQPAWDRFSAN